MLIDDLNDIEPGLGDAFQDGDQFEFLQLVKGVNDRENVLDLFLENGCKYFLNPEK